MTQWDYLHLAGLRRELIEILSAMPLSTGPVLDLFCGTKPYLELIPWRPVWGVDVDNHFGRADVLGTLPLPFRDGAIQVALCTQALYLLDDPVRTIEEIARVLAADGHIIVTIPHLFWGEPGLERHWSRGDLRQLFVGWQDIRIRGIDGPAAALAFVIGRATMLGAQRWRFVRPVCTPIVVLTNFVCAALDRLLTPFHRRWPHSLLLVARRPP